MITIDKVNNRLILNRCVFKMKNYWIYWRQDVRRDGTLIKIGFFYWAERHSKGWAGTLKDRISKMVLNK